MRSREKSKIINAIDLTTAAAVKPERKVKMKKKTKKKWNSKIILKGSNVTVLLLLWVGACDVRDAINQRCKNMNNIQQ